MMTVPAAGGRRGGEALDIFDPVLPVEARLLLWKPGFLDSPRRSPASKPEAGLPNTLSAARTARRCGTTRPGPGPPGTAPPGAAGTRRSSRATTAPAPGRPG